MTVSDERKATLTLPAEDQILVTREFDAPKHLVYRAWTTPELVARWWTARRGTAKEMEIDLRVGGRWRYVMETALNTASFVEREGGTTLTLLTQCPSPEVREMIIASGMEDGLQDALDLLEEVTSELS